MNNVSDVISDLEGDIIADEKLNTLIQEDASFAHEMYCALCNVIWTSPNRNQFTASWRYAGGVVANLTGRGEDYLDYYCSGGEGIVSARVETEMKRIGWSWKHYEHDRV
jgi:hypothetical protein